MHDPHHVDHVEESGHNDPRGFLTGLLIGSLAGAAAMLLLAPQSGKRTRAHLQQRGFDLRDQASERVDHAVAQAGVKARQIKVGVREKAEDLQERGQELLDEQRERLTAAVAAGKMTLHG
jgi:gas vesicle protein